MEEELRTLKEKVAQFDHCVYIQLEPDEEHIDMGLTWCDCTNKPYIIYPTNNWGRSLRKAKMLAKRYQRPAYICVNLVDAGWIRERIILP